MTSNMPVPSLVHVGLPKTATTSLQAYLAGIPNLAYAGRQIADRDTTDTYVTKRVLTDSEASFETAAPDLRAALQARAATGDAFVYSDEALTIGDGAWHGPKSRPGRQASPAQIPNRLATLFPGARVLIVLRNQETWLPSYYVQMRRIGTAGRDFDEWFNSHEVDGESALMQILDYDRLYRAYADALGPERVHVAFFEDVAADFDGFLAHVADILGVAPPARMPAGTHLNARGRPHPTLRRLAGRMLPLARVKRIAPATFEGIKRVLPREPSDIALSPGQRDRVRGRFGPSNARLGETLGRSLPSAYPLA